MYAVLTKRVVKRATVAGGRYDARHVNRIGSTVSGPFSTREVAEQAALAALGQHTCLSSQVLSVAALADLVSSLGYHTGHEAVGEITAAQEFLRRIAADLSETLEDEDDV